MDMGVDGYALPKPQKIIWKIKKMTLY